MVNSKSSAFWFFALATYMLTSDFAYSADYKVISQEVEADACDDRQSGDDVKTAENRAVDKAGLSAVKTAGFIQKEYPELTSSALDLIAYRIIDEYMMEQKHSVTLDDDKRVCVKLNAEVELTSQELADLVEEYKNSEAPEEQIAAVAQNVNKTMSFKPRNLQEKKLLYIRNMKFWNGDETNHYYDLLVGLFSHSNYFYVTEDEKLADFIVTPRLQKSEVDEIDRHHHKMQLQVEIETFSRTIEEFSPLSERQNHFILFAADKDEQKIADDLLRKLLTRAANEMSAKIDNFESSQIEKSARIGK